MKLLISDNIHGVAVSSETLRSVSEFVIHTFCKSFGLFTNKLTIIFDETLNPDKCGSISVFGMPGQVPVEILIRVFIRNPHFRKRTLLRVTDTLIHELIHYLQYELGHLAMSLTGHSWKGVEVRKSKSYREYRNLPWEKEAFKLSGPMTNEMKIELYKQFQLAELLEVTFMEKLLKLFMKG